MGTPDKLTVDRPNRCGNSYRSPPDTAARIVKPDRGILRKELGKIKDVRF